MASMNTRTRKLLDVEAELLDELGAFADARRAPPRRQDRECGRTRRGCTTASQRVLAPQHEVGWRPFANAGTGRMLAWSNSGLRSPHLSAVTRKHPVEILS
jgi:hypothetical protein